MCHFFIMSFDSITSGRFFHYNKKDPLLYMFYDRHELNNNG